MTARSAPLRVGLAGFGTVGRAVARQLQRETDVDLVAILNRRAPIWPAGAVADPVRWTDSIDDLLDFQLDVFVELIGGRDPATDWIRAALRRGISVVTANKQVMAHDGPELLALAAEHGCQLRYEASVAGGVPVLRAIGGGLAGDTLVGLRGILNGTCNYILSRMEQDGASFSVALEEAQRLGFAEANPSQDIDGLDARAKLAILAFIGFHLHAPVDAIAARSIAPVTPFDFTYARRLGCTIRQVASASCDASRRQLSAAVGPALVSLDSPLARVSGSENLVTVTGELGGETTYGGRGAGGDPTAVAVVSDVLAIARRATASTPRRFTAVGEVADASAAPYYLRFTVRDRPGIIAALAAILAARDINIDAILQEPGFASTARPFVVTIDPAPASAIHGALDDIRALDFHVADPLALPIVTAAVTEVVA